MKNSKFVKNSGLLVMAVVIGGGLLFFTSANTLDSVNSEAIVELTAELADMNAELAALKKVQNAGSVSEYPFIGEISMFAGNYAPLGWAFCDGRIISIDENQALYSLLGVTYGGDGRKTFGLPDLRGRVPVGFGKGPELPDHQIGSKFGVKTSEANTTVTAGALTVNYIIALRGIWPSRN
jgi:microcystin-dependent protein